jgi:hypothetical protein
MIEAGILLLAVAVVLTGAIVLRPLLGACLFLVLNPLVVGIARGQLGAELRPNEALLGFILAALALRVLLLVLAGRWRAAPFDRMDAVLIALVVTGSLMPPLWRALRALPLSADDLLYSAVLVKYYALYRLFRGAVVDAEDVAACLRASLAVAAVVAVVALLETFRLAGVAGFLAAHYDQPFSGSEGLVSGRATATIASAFGLADFMTLNLLVALALLRIARRGRGLLTASAALSFCGCLVTGTISGYIGLVVALFAFGTLTGRLHRMLPGAAIAGVVAAIAFWPVIEGRFAEFMKPQGLPTSWLGRWTNLQRFFLPELGADGNWLLGVRPAPRLPAPDAWRDWVYIESGYVWLLWIGGLPFLLAFLAFVVVALRRLLAVARARADATGAAALAGACATLLVATLMLFDPHLTIRGGADLFFPLLALGMAAAPLRATSPERPRSPGRQVLAVPGRRLACG